MDPWSVREQSLATLDELGWPRPPQHYPVLWEGGEVAVRSRDEMLRRVAALNVVVNRAFKCPPSLAGVWLAANGLEAELTVRERPFVEGRMADDGRFLERMEALWGLLWALGPGDHIDPREACSDTIQSLVPDLRTNEPFAQWVARVPWSPRSVEELVEVLDLYYCLDWAIDDVSRRGIPVPAITAPHIVQQRRWALEWCVRLDATGSFANWEDVEMST